MIPVYARLGRAMTLIYAGNRRYGPRATRLMAEVTRLIGFLIGLACGAGELYLLVLLARALQNAESGKILAYALLKLALLALAFVPVILFVRDELLWCSVGVTATLIVGAFVVNWKNRRSGEGDQ